MTEPLSGVLTTEMSGQFTTTEAPFEAGSVMVASTVAMLSIVPHSPLAVSLTRWMGPLRRAGAEGGERAIEVSGSRPVR